MEVNVLVIDDAQPLRDFVVQALAERGGFAVMQAADGVEGLEMALAHRPDLILVDLEMPRMGGVQVLDALRERGVEIPIILMTSYGSETVAVEVFRKGVKDYLTKPFTVEEMFASIERALAEARLRQEKDRLTEHLAATNEQLQRRVEELGILYQVGKSITARLARDEVLERILESVFFIIGAEEAALMLLDEQSGKMRTALYYQRVPGQVHQVARRSPEELATQAAASGDATASGAMLYAPLRVGERSVGALGVGNRVSMRPFSSHDRRLLLALADYAAVAIENARLYEEVQAANKAKSEFVSLVAHELRTPMTSIRGYADMLRKGIVGPLTEQQATFINTIYDNVERMRILVADLQDIARIEAGYMRLEVKPVALAEALEGALQTMRPQIEAKEQQLTLDVPHDLPPVQADPNRLVQVLTNLLSNACKYTPQEGHLAVRAWADGRFVHCAVADDGIGISEEDQAHLFTKFFRSGDPMVRDQAGTGLGLCVVKSLVEFQGGEIKVESQLGKGTTVLFTVPIASF